MTEEHKGFKKGKWQHTIDVANFIKENHKAYLGDKSFLAKPTNRTQKIWKKIENLIKKEHENGGVLDIDTETPSTITSHKPGYIDKKNELIFGLQTDKPLKRAIKPKGGVRLVKRACESYGYKLSPKVEEIYGKHCKTHNEAVFDIYKYWDDFHTPDGQLFRKKGVITGLPDAYGRGRIIGDYRRVALYGVDRLIEDKLDYQQKHYREMTEENIRNRQETTFQVQALKDMKEMAMSYGFDIAGPAKNFKEAVQWLYFAYLAAVKEQDGAAMSLGKVDVFLDVYAERDFKKKALTEEKVQEIIDDFVIKLRIVKQLRIPEYNELFAGDPTWVTCVVGGQKLNNETWVNKTSYRLLHTLVNLGPSPEPNLTVLWSTSSPDNFKKFASNISINTSSIQFENDDLMRPIYGDDYGIACCVSAMEIGEQMQFFGARCNLPKLLLLALNQGRDEFDGSIILEDVPKLKKEKNLDYKEVKSVFFKLIDKLTEKYVNIMNVIHYMHDHYYYENSQMALHDSDLKRVMAFGIAGISIVADSLSAIKYGKVKAIRNKKGITQSFEFKKDFPTYGSDDDRVDKIAIAVVKHFTESLKKHKTYRNAEHTLSLLTITANVVYGKYTGATPDGRKAKEPFAPGANPMHNRDKQGVISSLNSVAKIPYEYCLDGISNTMSIDPFSLGKNEEQKINNLKGVLDGYFTKRGQHLNVNVLNRDVLKDAQKNPVNYPNLTIRVSGYAVKFNNLSKEQQDEVINRTFHEKM